MELKNLQKEMRKAAIKAWEDIDKMPITDLMKRVVDKNKDIKITVNEMKLLRKLMVQQATPAIETKIKTQLDKVFEMQAQRKDRLMREFFKDDGFSKMGDDVDSL